MASEEGLKGTVAKLLALGADAALLDGVRVCPYVKIGYTNCIRLYVLGIYIPFTDSLHIFTPLSGCILGIYIPNGYTNCIRLSSAYTFHLQILFKPVLLSQDGKTALWLACINKHEAAAAELMEPTKRAGALDLQDGRNKQSVLHGASEEGLTGTVAKLLALGADAALTDANGKSPLELARNDETMAAFAEHIVITDDNKNMLLLVCARLGLVSRLCTVLQAGANAAHTNEVRAHV